MSNKGKYSIVTKATGPLQRPAEHARLVVVAGVSVGRSYLIQGTVCIGRGLDAGVLLDDDEISRTHATIEKIDGQFFVNDAGSRNGTFLDGIPVTEPKLLSYGAKIQLGTHSVLQFARHDPAEEELKQRQRLEALGRLGAGVAHDFNNMLAAILAATGYLEDLPKERLDDEVREVLGDIRAAAGRAADLTPRLLAFASPGSKGHRVVDLSAVCCEVARLSARTFPRSIVCQADIAEGVNVVGDSVELHQILMNLCINARDAMPHGGVLEVRLTLLPDSPSAVLTVRDSGVGMSADTRSRIFEPFFTTKREHAGFGLGLASVKDMVEAHSGQIEVSSRERAGTEFRVVLPTTKKGVRRISDRRPRTTTGATGTVLVVDDEPLVRRSAVRTLTAAGFEVFEVASGEAALSWYRDRITPPALVLLDLDMPGLSGAETLRALLAHDSDARVVIVTGHVVAPDDRTVIPAGAAGFLSKPWLPGELEDAVDAAVTKKALPRADRKTGDPSTRPKKK